VGPTDGGLPRDPPGLGVEGEIWRHPSLGTQVEGLLELFFYFTLQIWGRGLIEGLLELLLAHALYLIDAEMVSTRTVHVNVMEKLYYT